MPCPETADGSSSWTRPVSGSWSVAMMRMSVDFPAPLGPSKPNMPCGIASETSSSARVPFGYVLERFSMRSSIESPEDLQSQQQHGARLHLAARERGTHDVGGEARGSALDEVAR